MRRLRAAAGLSLLLTLVATPAHAQDALRARPTVATLASLVGHPVALIGPDPDPLAAPTATRPPVALADLHTLLVDLAERLAFLQDRLTGLQEQIDALGVQAHSDTGATHGDLWQLRDDLLAVIRARPK